MRKTVKKKVEADPRPPTRTEQFIRIWQDSDTAGEVAERMGWNIGSCYSFSSRTRSRGIPLKYMPGGRPKIDYAEMARIAKELSPR